MGWEGRDWARLNAEEQQLLYGVTPPRTTARTIVWAGTAVAAVLVGGFAYSQRPAPAQAVGPASGPTVIFGERGTQGGAERTGPGGTDAVCTEIALGSDGRLSCTTWTINLRRLPVIAPRKYIGPCADAVADQKAGRWVCVSGVPPAPAATPGQA